MPSEFKTTPSVFIHLSPGGPIFACQDCHRQQWYSEGRYLCTGKCESRLTPEPSEDGFFFCHYCGLVLTPLKRSEMRSCNICGLAIYDKTLALESVSAHIACTPWSNSKQSPKRDKASPAEEKCKRCGKTEAESPRYTHPSRGRAFATCISCTAEKRREKSAAKVDRR